MTWFERLTGFAEHSPQYVREHIVIEADKLISRINGKAYRYGELQTPSLAELRERVGNARCVDGELQLREVIADVTALHTDPANAGSLFQVASQFNLLEMVDPSVTPEHGVGIYEDDYTQGPRCAIAAGAGTIYRNYFAQVNGCIGQSRDNQIDCLADLGAEMGNAEQVLWAMRNGYALASHHNLIEIDRRLSNLSEQERDRLRGLVRIGVQWNTQVTINDSQHTVTQIYCSALPVAYSEHPAERWELFARLVLEAAYEASLCAAILNAQQQDNNTVFLTLLGGGAFGNHPAWIVDALSRALRLYRHWHLDVALVSHHRPNPDIETLIVDFTH